MGKLDLDSFDTTEIRDLKPGVGMVVSDLHLGQPGSKGVQTLSDLRKQIHREAPSLIILNGDIIEAKNRNGSPEDIKNHLDYCVGLLRETIRDAIAVNPDCRIAYVLGNHDNYFPLLKRLDGLRKEFPDHFSVHSSYAKIGETAIATHGDLPLDTQFSHRKMLKGMISPDSFTIQSGTLDRHHHGKAASYKTLPEEPKNTLQRLAARTKKFGKSIVFGRVDQIAAGRVFSMDKVIPAVAETLEKYPQLDRVSHVLMGHFHTPMDTWGKRMVNGREIEVRITGPSTIGSHTTMLRFDIAPDTLELSNFKNFSPDVEKKASRSAALADLPYLHGHACGSWRAYLDAPHHAPPTDRRR